MAYRRKGKSGYFVFDLNFDGSMYSSVLCIDWLIDWLIDRLIDWLIVDSVEIQVEIYEGWCTVVPKYWTQGLMFYWLKFPFINLKWKLR